MTFIYIVKTFIASKAHTIEKNIFFVNLLCFILGIYLSFHYHYPYLLGLIALLGITFLFYKNLTLLKSYIAFGLGILIALIHIYFLHKPLLQEKLNNVQIHGFITKVSTNFSKPSLIIKVKDERFDHIKLYLRKSDYLNKYQLGQEVRFMAHLYPFKTYNIFDKYDIAFWSYFQDTQAKAYAQTNGLILSTPKQISYIDQIRIWIAEKIDATNIQHTGLSKALLIGDKGSLDLDLVEDIRGSGLAHLLAISGLHIAMVAGIFFLFFRKLLSFFYTLSLHYSLKKWSALLAWIAVTGYFLISGQSLPTIRAILMASLVFLAILIDRPIFTLRNVSIAAIVILVFQPEQLFSVGFQLSFAAVACLIYYFQYYHHRLQIENFWYRLRNLIIGIIVSSFLASLSTLPVILYHFGTASIYSVLGNLVAIPLMSFFIMPLLILALLAMPFGYEGFFLNLADMFLSLFSGWAHYISALPYAQITYDLSMPQAGLIFLAIFILLFVKKFKIIFSSATLLCFFLYTNLSIKPLLEIQIQPSNAYLMLDDRQRIGLLQRKTQRFTQYMIGDFKCSDHYCAYKDLLILVKNPDQVTEICQYEYIFSLKEHLQLPCVEKPTIFTSDDSRFNIRLYENDGISITSEIDYKGKFPWVF